MLLLGTAMDADDGSFAGTGANALLEPEPYFLDDRLSCDEKQEKQLISRQNFLKNKIK